MSRSRATRDRLGRTSKFWKTTCLAGTVTYTAMEFVGDHVLLAHCAGDRRREGLDTTQITRIPVTWLYQVD